MLNGMLSEGYGIIPKKLMKMKGLNIYAKGVMAYLLSHTGAGKIECWPTIETISNDLEIAQSTVKKSIQSLIDLHFIEKEKMYKNDPLKSNNKYKLVILEDTDDLTGYLGKPCDTLPTAVLRTSESRTADANNNIYNNNNNNNIKKNNKKTVIPLLQEVIDYFKENEYDIEIAIKAYNYYNAADWHDSKGNPVRSWKQKMHAVWFKPEYKIIKPKSYTSGVIYHGERG